MNLDEAGLREAVRPRFRRALERDEVYLANHSLGRPLDRTADDVREGLDLWYRRMDESWEPWLAEAERWRANLARLLGFTRGDSVIPKSSAGHGLRTVLNAFPQDRPVRVVTTTGEFDSVDFILKTYEERGRAEVGWVGPSGTEGPVPIFTAEPMIRALDGAPGLVVASLVFFGTGQILRDADLLVQEAHRRGWLVLLDVYHAAGVIPLELETLGADFAVGGSYKYLRGGPGACYLAIHPRHLSWDSPLRSLDTGWFAKRDMWAFERLEASRYAEGGNSWLESTPAALLPYQARAGLEFVLEVGVDRLREHSLETQRVMRDRFLAEGIPMFVPGDCAAYGGFSLMPHADPPAFARALKARGVNVDARGRFVRFGPDLLTTRAELERAASAASNLDLSA